MSEGESRTITVGSKAAGPVQEQQLRESVGLIHKHRHGKQDGLVCPSGTAHPLRRPPSSFLNSYQLISQYANVQAYGGILTHHISVPCGSQWPLEYTTIFYKGGHMFLAQATLLVSVRSGFRAAYCVWRITYPGRKPDKLLGLPKIVSKHPDKRLPCGARLCERSSL